MIGPVPVGSPSREIPIGESNGEENGRPDVVVSSRNTTGP